MNPKLTEYFPSLEGIRGYAFLVVFVLHYWGHWETPTHLSAYPQFLITNTMWFLVPIFFVLSGFLITRILLATREREGYFKVFYFRRAIRVLPLYYLTVITVLSLIAIFHLGWNSQYWLYLLYMQNFSAACSNFRGLYQHTLVMGHLWSMGIEEQFYLLWPLAIWWLKSEKNVLRFSYWLIAASTIIRFAWPLFHLPYEYAYDVTFTRFDGIVLGAVLAIHFKRRTHWEKAVQYSKILIPTIWAGMVVLAITTGSSSPVNYVGTAICIPLMNIVGLCFVILALEPSSRVSRWCSGDRICNFGRLSYGMYLFHEIYSAYFREQVFHAFARYMPRIIAQPLVAILAFGLTLVLAKTTYRFLEEPAMRMKNRVKYGPAKVSVQEPVPAPVPELPSPSTMSRSMPMMVAPVSS